nr:hypothetical protein [Tanacetum cinerariifolium]
WDVLPAPHVAACWRPAGRGWRAQRCRAAPIAVAVGPGGCRSRPGFARCGCARLRAGWCAGRGHRSSRGRPSPGARSAGRAGQTQLLVHKLLGVVHKYRIAHDAHRQVHAGAGREQRHRPNAPVHPPATPAAVELVLRQRQNAGHQKRGYADKHAVN